MELPARIGKYELEEFLGGGMSHVYRARDTVIGRTVAVKILTEAGCADPEAKERFLLEARLAGNIAHDNVISIYDFGEDDQKRPFMVMEFLRGEDLRNAIRNGHTGTAAGKLEIALQIARALEYIHQQRIIHRDIKPENVHITQSGVVKLMDFGISKTEGFSMTRAGYVLGTPYYMAPEQVMGKEVTPQVDVYAFGILLFELFTGNKPFSGDSVERLFYSILNEPLNLEPLQQCGAPEPVCDLVRHCTAKDAAQRPQGFTPVCRAIERAIDALKPEPTLALEPPPAAAPPPARKTWLLAASGAALVLLVVLFLVLRPKSRVDEGPQYPATLSTPTGEMVLVPAGPFQFGQKKESISLPAFYIDKTEVSNRAWALFAKAVGRPVPAGDPDLPVVDITILDAQEFARWAGKRLPTAREWEKAARGVDGRIFPWGNDRDTTRANVNSVSTGTQAVYSYANGASPYGALNMAGNVMEFVDQLSSPSAQARVFFARQLQPPPGPSEPWFTIRGASFNSPLEDNILWDSTTVPVRWHEVNIGFRCVKDVPGK